MPYRPRNPAILAKHPSPAVNTFILAYVFGIWRDVQKQNFADGGTFD
jgi:ABC-type sulfate transport system substrate-binding protein